MQPWGNTNGPDRLVRAVRVSSPLPPAAGLTAGGRGMDHSLVLFISSSKVSPV